MTRKPALAALVLAFSVNVAQATVTTTTVATQSFSATAKVINNCLISGLTTIDFGDYDPASANATAAKPGATDFTVKCTKGMVPILALDNGGNFSAGTRRMASGTNFLNYTLIQPDPTTSSIAGTAAWGSGTSA